MGKTKLKPCPFCGSTNIIIGHFIVYCEDCRCQTEEGIPTEDAIEKWNKRHEEPIDFLEPH